MTGVAASHEKLLRMKDLIQLIGLCRSSIYSKLSPKSRAYDPSFPKAIKLGERAVGWKFSEVIIWVNSQNRN